MGKTLTEIAQQLRDADKKVQLIYAFNGIGKTRLRNLYGKTASFLGCQKWGELLPEDRRLYLNRTIQFTSHSTLSNEAVAEPTQEEKAMVKYLPGHLKNSHRFWPQEEQNA